MNINRNEVKVVILGPQGVGKTSIAMRYTGKKFSRSLSPTIGSSYFPHSLTIRGITLLIEIWDTAGQERFKSMAPLYYRSAKAAIVVYDITSKESFLGLKVWVRELLRNVDNNIILCIVGNKTDLQSERMVSFEDAESYAASINAEYFETSALTHSGIDDIFSYIANKQITAYNNKCKSFSFNESLEYSDLYSTQTKLHLNQSQNDKSLSCCK